VEPNVLVNGKTYAVLIAVRLRADEAAVRVALDGRPHLNWSGKQQAVSTEGWPTTPGRQLALGTNEVVTFHSARLRPLTGRATLALAERRP
jgi:hypothetical protein